MRRTQYAGVICFISAVCLSHSAYAQDALQDLAVDSDKGASVSDIQPACTDSLDVVNDLAPYIAIDTFRGQSQGIQQLVYSRSACLRKNGPGEKHLDRWKLEASAVHVAGGGYTAEGGSLGLGLELHPFKQAQGLSFIPIGRIEYDDFNGNGHSFAWGGELTVEDIINLETPKKINLPPVEGSTAKSRVAWVPNHQLILAVRVNYQKQNILFSYLPNTTTHVENLTGFAMIGLDGHLKDSRKRWQTILSYQSLEHSAVKGYGSLELSYRHLKEDYATYRWIYKIIGNFGNHYSAALLSVDFRFK